MAIDQDKIAALAADQDTDPDGDTADLDRGDEVVVAKPAPKKPAAKTEVEDDEGDEDGRERDENGRFKKTKDKDADKDEPEEEEEEEAAGEKKDEPEEEEEEPEAPAKGKRKDVPYDRFAEVVKQKNEALARLASQEQTVGKKNDETRDEIKELTKSLDPLYEQVEELRKDGDTKAAAKVQRQIDEVKDKINESKTAITARREAFVQTENRVYNDMVSFLEANYPIMDKDAPEYDAKFVGEMEFQVTAYERMGMTSTAALKRAAALLFSADPFKPAAPKKDDIKKDEKKPEKKDDKGLAKKIDAAKRTPPDTAGTGRDKDQGKSTRSVEDMSDEEYDALPDSKKRALRGDDNA